MNIYIQAVKGYKRQPSGFEMPIEQQICVELPNPTDLLDSVKTVAEQIKSKCLYHGSVVRYRYHRLLSEQKDGNEERESELIGNLTVLLLPEKIYQPTSTNPEEHEDYTKHKKRRAAFRQEFGIGEGGLLADIGINFRVDFGPTPKFGGI